MDGVLDCLILLLLLLDVTLDAVLLLDDEVDNVALLVLGAKEVEAHLELLEGGHHADLLGVVKDGLRELVPMREDLGGLGFTARRNLNMRTRGGLARESWLALLLLGFWEVEVADFWIKLDHALHLVLELDDLLLLED